MSKIDLTALRKFHQSLKQGYKDNPTDLERDGIIQRFEYTIERCWKSSKKVLASNNIETDVPKSVFRKMAELDWIDSAENWIEYLNARNLASHVYNEKIAAEAFSVINRFIVDSENLIEVLEKKS